MAVVEVEEGIYRRDKDKLAIWDFRIATERRVPPGLE